MLKVGDKVKFLNDIGGGRVVHFQSKSIAVVENEDGFEIPVMITELIKVAEVESYTSVRRDFSKPTEPKVVEPDPEPEHVAEIIEGNDDPNFFLAFHPVDQHNPVGGEIEVYLINDSNFTLLYQYAHFDGHKYETVSAGELESNTKQHLEGLTTIEISNLPKFWLRIIPYVKEAKRLVEPISKEITVNSVKFFKEKSFTTNDYFDGNAMIFDISANPLKDEVDKLTDSDFKKIVKEKDKGSRPIEPKKAIVKIPDIVEVDLHIEELIDSTAGLSNREILDVQMDKFEREMKLALENKVKRIVFIHGVGNGVLKQEVSKKLKSTYARFNYQDASFKEYGYGATMVVLRRK
ncbi:MAG: DUF2027 domain-containing protein [Prolixibacteraceae bacterium]|jgi:hypothetical protein|nr:DUF2027 domain-containing protein [Prolixibacteraceae bacterium]